MPIEKVTLTPDDRISLSAKGLEREELWYKELCTVYPYGRLGMYRSVGQRW
jgi:hypothetical protein